MNSRRSLLFIALGLFGLYAVEFGVIGILPAIIQRHGITVAQAGWLVALFAGVVAVCGPVMVLWLARFERRKVLAVSLLIFSLCSLLSALSLYPADRAAHATSMAFLGTTLGLVLGVPLSTWIEATVSYEASFYFSAVVNLVAAAGLWVMLPPRPNTRVASQQNPLLVLRTKRVWLAVATAVCMFAAMFSVYSYAAEYLAREVHLGGEAISLLLVVFGVGGVLGNLIAGRALGRQLAWTVLSYPIVLASAIVCCWCSVQRLSQPCCLSAYCGAQHTPVA